MKKILFAILLGVIVSTIFIPLLAINVHAAERTETCKYFDKSSNTEKEATCKIGERNTSCCPEGLMVCGKPCCRCRFCDIFTLIDHIIDFAVFKLAPIAAVILIIIGGTMFLVSSGNPGTITRAKSIIFSVIIGLAIMYSSYMIVGFILKSIGIAQWTADMYSSWISKGVFEIDCGGTSTSGGGSAPTGGSGGPSGGGVANPLCVSYTGSDISKESCQFYADKNRFDLCSTNPCGVHGGGPNACQYYPSPPGCVNK